MRSVADALRAVLERVPRLAAERVAVAAAHGRVLAADVVAARPLPGFDNSAMDGYAARAAELPGTLPVAGVIAAGAAPGPAVPAGHAVRIFTGAPLPPELDVVVMQEDAAVAGDRVTLPAAARGDHVRRAGEDVAVGDRVIAAGTRLTAWHLGVLAALGVAELEVARAPRVALIATGDELVDVTVAPGPGQLVDSSAYAIAAMVAEAGGAPHRLGIVGDDLDAVAERLAAAAAAFDVVITTGGVSVGDRDHVRDGYARAGIALELWKVAMKPGKPFAFGTRGDAVVFGLPGNPVSSVIACELFVAPALRAMQGARVVERPRVPVRLAAGYRKPPGRAHYLRATAVRQGEQLIALVHPKQGSAMLSSLIDANAVVEIAAELGELAAGAIAPALLREPV